MASTIAPTDAGPSARLDDVMLAMDVVDTLRHRDEWVSREIDEAGREADLMARLRAIYAGQGIQVSDAVLVQGIRALDESRFVYTPPEPNLATSLALLWVERNRYLKAAAALVLLVAALAGAYYETRVRPLRQTASALEAAHSEAVAEAAGPAGRERADRLLDAGAAALEESDTGAAAQALGDLRSLRASLQSEYELRIVSTAFKVPPTALHERIRYLIVEAVAPDGGILTLPVANGEAKAPQPVARWGIAVNPDVYLAVDQDLKADGRIDDAALGVKRRGEPDVEFLKPVLGKTITEW